MKTRKGSSSHTLATHVRHCCLFALIACALPVLSAEFRIDYFQLTNGQAEVSVTNDPAAYFMLRRGNYPAGIWQMVDLGLAGSVLRDAAPTNTAQFYRVEQVPVLAPRDSDGDGLDDLWELMRRPLGAALNPEDAEQDLDGNGITDRLDFLRARLNPGSVAGRAVMSLGSGHALALRQDGSLWGWGDNLSQQLAWTGGSDTNLPSPIGTNLNWKAVAAGNSSSFALRADGTLWAWGHNVDGRLGLPASAPVSVPTQVGTDSDWATISTIGQSTVALKRDGSLWAWPLGNPGPQRLEANHAWLAITFGGQGAMAIRADGSLWQWLLSLSSQPSQVGIDTNWSSIAAGGYHVLALKKDQSLWAWAPFSASGSVSGQLGLGNYNIATTPTQVGTDTNWIAIGAGLLHSVALQSDGSVWGWGDNSYGQLGLGSLPETNRPSLMDGSHDWISIVAGIDNTIALRADVTLVTWGRNSFGQLGQGVTWVSKEPTQIGNSSNWTAIAAGTSHSMAVDSGGHLWSWGRNSRGQLGLGYFNAFNMPTIVGSETNWLVASAGSSHSVALKTDGSLWSWGMSIVATQTGEGSVITNVPTQVGVDLDWKTISAGQQYTLSLKRDGTLWGWGRNNGSQLGLGGGPALPRDIPTRIGTASNWQRLAAGATHSLAVKSNGTLWAWGNSLSGALGLGGAPGSQTTPAQVGFNTDWSDAASGKWDYSAAHTLV